MPQKLLDVLMLGRCSHEFSWPRRATDGYYYQVCLLCAAEYKYDWKTMKRTERLDTTAAESYYRNAPAPPFQETNLGSAGSAPQAPYPGSLPGQEPGHLARRASIENLSQSGVLLRGPQPFPDNTLVEMVFEMPEEISGQKNSTVLCQGRIIRSKPIPDGNEATGLAASILDYKFLRQH